ncbi:hypothetical protein RO3G_12108 [Rhizopus delemar RA 99-880]|uniref:Uncharacterized protein n=1 Tax=Rhizopus delemar (strain RA 99-880 / ATCC MYA-4621 / FGSC 9543 / NRRL 43880) TaxID=246409 RepID=I1CG17_RHIO9|nr:hypothetical protein RO3G_12108 [Rhizopus delemar RA 99-880]|eukprot:EIE87397.1 hypothetical protein RO3G_12108 [Rhizopus delemar RA 99-880]
MNNAHALFTIIISCSSLQNNIRHKLQLQSPKKAAKRSLKSTLIYSILSLITFSSRYYL